MLISKVDCFEFGRSKTDFLKVDYLKKLHFLEVGSVSDNFG